MKLDPPFKTFNDFTIALTSMITKAGQYSDDIHIVFDNYREDSIKIEEGDRVVKSNKVSTHLSYNFVTSQFFQFFVS